MPLAPVPLVKVQDILESVTEHSRFIMIVRAMAREIERLNEDNTQLRAAVAMYRAVLRRYAVRTGAA